MKTSIFWTLNTVLLFDLILAEYKNGSEGLVTISDSNKSSYLATIAVGNGGNADEEYFVSVTGDEAILSVKEHVDKANEKTPILRTVDTQRFPNGFIVNDAEIDLTFLRANESVLFCTGNVQSAPECLLIRLHGRPYSGMEPLIPILNDYRHQESSIVSWNTFRVPAEDGNVLVMVYMNQTGTRKTGWLVRQRLDKKTGLSSSGRAMDHGLPQLKGSYNASENVYTFRHQGFVYVLRYAYRSNRINRIGYEWAWQLTRVCLHDQTRDLRSRISIPLGCQFQRNPTEQIVGWRPTRAYLDGKTGQLYVYIQPNVSYANQETLKQLRHRICTFDMNSVINEFERTFNRCYNEYSPAVAAHGASSRTSPCSEFREDSGYKCRYDICNSEECVVNPFYHLESYEPFYGTMAAIVDFQHELDSNIMASSDAPLNMYVTSSIAGLPETTQAFIRNVHGTVFMVFLNGTKTDVNIPRSPAWTSSFNYYGNEKHWHLLELPDRDGVQLLGSPNSQIRVFKAGCSIFTMCQDLIDKLTGDQARRLWACGWCQGEDWGIGATEKECRRAKGLFHKDTCPPMAKCYTPRSWRTEENVTLEIDGYFPRSYAYKVYACGSHCQRIRGASKDVEDRLTCVASSLPSGSDPQHGCTVEIVVVDAANESRVLNVLRPLCENDTLFQSTIHGSGRAGHIDIAWIAFGIITPFIIVAIIIYVIRSYQRRQQKRRERPYGSLGHPMTVTVELSRDNEYVQRVVNRGNQQAILTIDGAFEDLSQVVPPEFLIHPESIRIHPDSLIGSGHFGQVFKGIYTPSENIDITVAIKTLPGPYGERNAQEFLKEGIIMEQFNHDHVLSLIGISFTNANLPMIIMPYMAKGDLLSYIRNPQNKPTVGQLLQFGVEIINGMQYLHKLKFIHRDLAARNCMLDDNLHVKIADFGLSRDVYESECYMSSQNDHLPIRWMPPESIERREYSLKSDVWSYGVVLWELMTRGHVPYAGMSGFEVLTYLKDGRRLARPPHCPEPVYEVVRSCWLLVPADRPDFVTLSDILPAAIREIEASSDSKLHSVNSPMYYNVSPVVPRQMVTSA